MIRAQFNKTETKMLLEAAKSFREADFDWLSENNKDYSKFKEKNWKSILKKLTKRQKK